MTDNDLELLIRSIHRTAQRLRRDDDPDSSVRMAFVPDYENGPGKFQATVTVKPKGARNRNLTATGTTLVAAVRSLETKVNAARNERNTR